MEIVALGPLWFSTKCCCCCLFCVDRISVAAIEENEWEQQWGKEKAVPLPFHPSQPAAGSRSTLSRWLFLISPKVGGDTESCGEGERKKKKKRFRMSADMHLKNISSPHHHPSLSLSLLHSTKTWNGWASPCKDELDLPPQRPTTTYR